MVQIGDRIRITSDNESYKPYLDKIWTVTEVSFSTNDHRLYDVGVGGPLIDCDGLPFSLYEFEFEEV